MPRTDALAATCRCPPLPWTPSDTYSWVPSEERGALRFLPNPADTQGARQAGNRAPKAGTRTKTRTNENEDFKESEERLTTRRELRRHVTKSKVTPKHKGTDKSKGKKEDMTKKFTFKVSWSEADQEYVGLLSSSRWHRFRPTQYGPRARERRPACGDLSTS